ncbi:L-seryl-tRNA(Sec) selenium transferase [candidate division KSB1 bacterium]|nr:L-seryl-tRNA(Sec) selenium transferase [candidate division KSB1 bacterium]
MSKLSRSLRTSFSLTDSRKLLANLPSVERMLVLWEKEGLKNFPRWVVAELIRTEIGQVREKVKRGKLSRVPDEGELLALVSDKLSKLFSPSLRRVINGTGIILHTGLGRAPFPHAVQESLVSLINSYTNLELDIESGRRGERIRHVKKLLCLLTGAEAAAVVNNNAAAVLLTLNTLSKRKEVIVSRGQLIEIGGSFRLPDVMAQSGAKMVEVGTTNRTRLSDYENAIGPRTRAILRVHPSNYRILGFTQEVPLEELVSLGEKYQLPIIDDLGSGVLVDLRKYGLPYEPVVSESIRKGAAVVCFSGDKVLGGPQAGILVGKKIYLDRIKKNSLMRALRCGKLTYAVLEAVLKLYFDEKKLVSNHPVFRMLTESAEDIGQRAKYLVESLKLKIKIDKLIIKVEDSEAETGGGALPLEKIPSKAVSIKPKRISVDRLAKAMRLNEPPIIGYVKDDKFYLNMRTVRNDEVGLIKEAIEKIFLDGG